MKAITKAEQEVYIETAKLAFFVFYIILSIYGLFLVDLFG